MAAGYDTAVDFMDMTEDRRLWTRSVDARAGVNTSVDRYVIVGDDDADPRVARIIERDAEGNIELEVLPGSVESHHDLLNPA